LSRILNENLIPYWTDQVPATAVGLAEFLAEDREGGRRLSLVLLARFLWFHAKLCRMSFASEDCRQLAAAAYELLMRYFLDKDEGGFFWEVDINAQRASRSGKHLYGQAFAIYALSAYARSNGGQEALAIADGLCDLLEGVAHDHDCGGYHEWFERDWSVGGGRGYLGVGADIKLVNTHIHVLEAFSALHRQSPRQLLKDRIAELIDILDRRTTRTRHGVAFDQHHSNWSPVRGRKNRFVSYGHEIESIHLLMDAFDSIGQSPQRSVGRMHKRFAYCMTYGFDFESGGVFEKGQLAKHASHKRKIWWIQAEAMLGALSMCSLVSEPAYLSVFERILGWITSQQVDWENGEWHSTVEPDGQTSGVKRGRWKGPYHTGRCVFESLALIERLLCDRSTKCAPLAASRRPTRS
jgi:mannobiose 2-epimerase